MTKHCTVPGCSETTAGYSTLCRHHKQAQRRHGDAAQGGITVHELKPYVARVAARQLKNRDGEAWAILTQRWTAIVDNAMHTLAAFEAGHPHIRHAVTAAAQVRNLAGSVPGESVVRTALAMYLLRDAEPYRFRSDRAFDYQSVRRVRGLTAVNAGTYWDAKTGRDRRVYRDLSPKAVEVLAGTLKSAFGLAGVMLAAKEREEAGKVDSERQRLAAALETLA